jgi:SET domain-containing protein
VNVVLDVVHTRVLVYATRTIHTGDELLLDYGTEYWKEAGIMWYRRQGKLIGKRVSLNSYIYLSSCSVLPFLCLTFCPIPLRRCVCNF